VAEELYRLGYHTHVVTGASVIRPRVFGTLNETLTNDAMGRGAADAIAGGAAAAVLAASVLDFNPSEKADGKLSSADRETLTVTMRRTPKLIAGINPASGVKVGFKLETKLTAGGAEGLAAKYMREYGLSLMVINDLADVDQARHQAWVFEAGRGVPGGPERIDGKSALALRIAAHVDARLTG
jgi:phosphopantothenoylcysteine synthetase/decarboxylase